MPDLSFILVHLSPLMLVASRLLGLFLFAPVLSSSLIPRRARVLLAFALAVAIYPVLPAGLQEIPSTTLIGLVPLLLSEVLIGIAIGVLASIPLTGIQMAGSLMGHQMGLGLAEVFDPDTQANSAVIDQILFLLGTATFVSLGGLDAVFLSLIRTFELLPIGGFGVDHTPLDLLVALVGSAFELAVRVGLPVIGLIGMIMVALGFIMRTVPQINVMTIGFAIKIIAGVLMLAAVIFVANGVLADEIGYAMGEVLDWSSSLVAGGEGAGG